MLAGRWGAGPLSFPDHDSDDCDDCDHYCDDDEDDEVGGTPMMTAVLR